MSTREVAMWRRWLAYAIAATLLAGSAYVVATAPDPFPDRPAVCPSP